MLFSDGVRIRLADLPPQVSSAVSSAEPGERTAEELAEMGLKDRSKQKISEIERDEIVKALEQTHGNVSQAAKLLKISRKTMQTKIKKFGLEGSRRRGGPESKNPAARRRDGVENPTRWRQGRVFLTL